MISNENFPKKNRAFVVGCYECHGLNKEKHKDNFDHFDFKINVIVSPNDCAVCHSREVQEYSNTKKAFAIDNLEKNPLYHTLVDTLNKTSTVSKNKVVPERTLKATNNSNCFACHGTRVEVKGMKTIISRSNEEVRVPILTNWPNHGVGRINPDGSKGSCTACHPRHSFSIETARKPFTCMQCHMGPDAPAWKVYENSKHGNIFLSEEQNWNWTHYPWRIGKDFKAPTCAVCHVSMLVSPDGEETIVEGTHDFGQRLWVRIFGLIYSHPQPKSGATFTIKNADNQPLPTTFAGKPATKYLIDKKEQNRRKKEMKKVCNACHSTDLIDGHFKNIDLANEETDKMVLAATKLMQHAWQQKIADPTNPFDESLEKKWILQWLFYSNTIRYAAAMSGPDYAGFKYGWWNLSKNLQDIQESIKIKKKLKRKK